MAGRRGLRLAVVAVLLGPMMVQPPMAWAQPAAVTEAADPSLAEPAIRLPTTEEQAEFIRLASLAAQARDAGKWEEMETHAKAMMAIGDATFGPEHPMARLWLGPVAMALDNRGRQGAAEPYRRRIYDLERRLSGPTSVVTLAAADGLAASLDGQARFKEAEALYRTTLEARRKSPGEADAETGVSYNRLGASLLQQGRAGEAEALFHKALEITRAARGDDHPSTASALNNLGMALSAQGRSAEAEALFAKALKGHQASSGEGSSATAITLSNQATGLVRRGREAEAEPLLRRVLEIQRATYGEDHPRTADAYDNLAGSLSGPKRLDEVETLRMKALEIRVAALPEGHPDIALSFENIAVVMGDQGRHAEAEPVLRQVLAMRRASLGDSHADVAATHFGLAMNLDSQGKAAEAEDQGYRAVYAARRVRDVASGGGADGQVRALLQARAAQGDGPDPLRGIYGLYLRLAMRQGLSDSKTARLMKLRAFVAAQDFTASAAERAMAQAKARVAAGEGALGTFVQVQQKLATAVRDKDAELLAALAKGDTAAAAKAREEREVALEVLDKVQQLRNFPAYAQLVSPRGVTVAELQKRLGEDEGLIMILPAGKDMFTFSVSRTDSRWSRLPNGVQISNERIARLRNKMNSPGRGLGAARELKTPVAGFDRQAAYDLYRTLIVPSEGALSGVKRLYVVANGPIAGLPLGVLMTSAGEADPATLAAPDAPWLSERYALSSLPAVSSLGVTGRDGAKAEVADGRTRPAAPIAFVGYGAPVLHGTGSPARGPGGKPAEGQAIVGSADGQPLADPKWLSSNFGPLAGPARELPRMARTLGAGRDAVRLGPAATERAVKGDRRLRTAKVVTFATHGFLPGQVPGVEEPGLIFTPPGKATALDDGVLTASEAAALEFTADWIILSACDTATSDGGSGAEGLSSLARAFLYAGAGALLASHWPVDDEATAMLTTETLALKAANPGMTRAQALQAAMRTVRTGKRADGSAVAGWTPKWADPAKWAAFTIITNQDR